jgi:hypothetical protein
MLGCCASEDSATEESYQGTASAVPLHSALADVVALTQRLKP